MVAWSKKLPRKAVNWIFIRRDEEPHAQQSDKQTKLFRRRETEWNDECVITITKDGTIEQLIIMSLLQWKIWKKQLSVLSCEECEVMCGGADKKWWRSIRNMLVPCVSSWVQSKREFCRDLALILSQYAQSTQHADLEEDSSFQHHHNCLWRAMNQQTVHAWSRCTLGGLRHCWYPLFLNDTNRPCEPPWVRKVVWTGSSRTRRHTCCRWASCATDTFHGKLWARRALLETRTRFVATNTTNKTTSKSTSSTTVSPIARGRSETPDLLRS